MKYRFFDEKKKHLHQLDKGNGWENLTGCSTVVGVIPFSNLYWASGMAVGLFGWLDPKKHTPSEALNRASEVLWQIKQLDTDGYLSLLEKAYKAHAEKKDLAAEKGTSLHELLEVFLKTGEIKDEKIMPVVEWYKKEVKRTIWSEVAGYDEDNWIGGISDWGVELNNGEYAIVDFKRAATAYEKNFWQMGGYNIILSKNGGFTRNGEKLFTLDKPITQHIVFPFGAEKVEAVVDRDVEGHKKAFLACLVLYREKEKINKTI